MSKKASIEVGVGKGKKHIAEVKEANREDKKSAKARRAVHAKTSRVNGFVEERRGLLTESTSFTTTEEYKMLRSSVSFAASTSAEGCKIIGITSALPKEGKTTTCLNLAISFALTRAKVLVIDCDLRKPSVSRFFSFASTPGISNVLAGMCSLAGATHKIKQAGESLCVIPSGDIPPNPSELLGSEKMGEALRELAKSYDYIFIDLPPVLLVSDALALSEQLSGVVVVVRAGATKKDEVRAALERLRFAQINISGFVLNRIQRTNGGRYYTPRYEAYRQSASK
jgi:capsular exopolysaccharide synthesis family protein